ncbi:MAG: biotin transporter BioY [Tissierellia bacterium]|nr:biotin transporter BioY [Tissierellia bacterium]
MKLTTKDLTQISMFAALTAIGAYVSVPIGHVPITLQSMFVLMSGVILGSKRGAISQIVYMVVGLIGLPVFAGGRGGIATIMTPSFGFIFGFVAMAYISGYLYERGVNVWISSFVATIVLYLVGLPYMAFILNSVMGNSFDFLKILNLGLIPFIPGDSLKVLATAFSLNALRKRIDLPI